MSFDPRVEVLHDLLLERLADLEDRLRELSGPEGDSALILARWLSAKPELASKVLEGVSLVGPWVEVHSEGSDAIRCLDLWHRGTQCLVARVAFVGQEDEEDEDVWRWYLADNVQGENFLAFRGFAATLEHALRVIEYALQARGWVLLPGRVRSQFNRSWSS